MEAQRMAIASICVCMVVSPGCAFLKRDKHFSAPTQPGIHQSAAVPEGAKTAGFADHAKEACVATVKLAATGLFLLTSSIFKGWLNAKDKDRKRFDPDPLWRAGYGFNNPNAERIRNGQPVLNFDGSVAD